MKIRDFKERIHLVLLLWRALISYEKSMKVSEFDKVVDVLLKLRKYLVDAYNINNVEGDELVKSSWHVALMCVRQRISWMDFAPRWERKMIMMLYDLRAKQD